MLATGGSSSGIGTAANFWAANVGTETSGSILSPSNQNMLVGDQADGRPHQPLRRDSDHRRSGHGRARWRSTVTDAAILLGALEGAAPDPNDPATQRVHAAAGPRLHAFLEARRPEGRAHRHPARVLLRRGHAARRAREPRGGLNADQAQVMAEAIAVLKQQGAVDRRSRRHSERRRSGSARTTSCCGTSARARATRRARTTTARSSSSTA